MLLPQFSVTAVAVFLLVVDRAVSNSQLLDKLVESVDKSSCINSIEEPRITVDASPEDKVAHVGDVVELNCGAFSAPQATVRWVLDGKPVANGLDFGSKLERVENAGIRTIGAAITNSVLRLPCVDSSNVGTYGCVVESGCHTKTFNAVVSVSDGGKQNCNNLASRTSATRGSKPHITMWTDTRMERSGAAAQLYCRAAGVPQPQIDWYEVDDAGAVSPIMPSNDIYVIPNGDLMVKKRDDKQGGNMYRCIAKNEHGQDERDVVLVEVDYEGDAAATNKKQQSPPQEQH